MRADEFNRVEDVIHCANHNRDYANTFTYHSPGWITRIDRSVDLKKLFLIILITWLLESDRCSLAKSSRAVLGDTETEITSVSAV